MSETAVRTPEELKRASALFQLQFSVQQYIVTKIVAELRDIDFVRLSANEEIIIPFSDSEVIDHLNIIDDQIGDFVALDMSLNQLGEEVKLSFDIIRNDEDITEYGFDPKRYPYLISLSAFPEVHYSVTASDDEHEIATELTASDRKVIAGSKWQENFFEKN